MTICWCFRLRKKSEFYHFNRNDGKTDVVPANEELLVNGLAYYQGSAAAYRKRLNRTTP